VQELTTAIFIGNSTLDIRGKGKGIMKIRKTKGNSIFAVTDLPSSTNGTPKRSKNKEIPERK
jgi:hypothetical protein